MIRKFPARVVLIASKSEALWQLNARGVTLKGDRSHCVWSEVDVIVPHMVPREKRLQPRFS